MWSLNQLHSWLQTSALQTALLLISLPCHVSISFPLLLMEQGCDRASTAELRTVRLWLAVVRLLVL